MISHPSLSVTVSNSQQLLNALSPISRRPGVVTKLLIPLSVKPLCFRLVTLYGRHIDQRSLQPWNMYLSRHCNELERWTRRSPLFSKTPS